MQDYTESELEAYLDEALAADEMASIEKSLRENSVLVQSLAAIIGRRDAGVHSLGEIWRRHRLSCPSRQDLKNYVMEVLPDETRAYVHFHVKTIGCRVCEANLNDIKRLNEAHQSHDAEATTRRQRIFQSSAGYLKQKPT